MRTILSPVRRACQDRGPPGTAGILARVGRWGVFGRARAGSPRLHGTSDNPLIRVRGPPARGQAPSSAAQYNPLQKEPAPGPATLPSTLGLGVDAGERAAPWTCTFSATMFPARQRSGYRCEYSQEGGLAGLGGASAGRGPASPRRAGLAKGNPPTGGIPDPSSYQAQVGIGGFPRAPLPGSAGFQPAAISRKRRYEHRPRARMLADSRNTATLAKMGSEWVFRCGGASRVRNGKTHPAPIFAPCRAPDLG